MQFLSDYLKNYGDIPFTEKPFNDVDNMAMCYMFYMPFEQVVSSSFDDEPVRFSRAASQLFAERGYEHKPVGLILLKDISKKMMVMARSRRYAEMKIVACTEIFEQNPAVQFGAATFLLPDGTIVVVFRGTDDSLIGWEEDFDILFKNSIPSQKLATDYLEQVASKFDGDIIVCGHSKGGYVAQYGALFCSKQTRDRIKLLYNNDGPGFKDYSFINTENYKEMLPKYKHFVPQSSFIGMMLAHDDDYQVVKSKRLFGPLQHDLSTWQLDGDKIKTTGDLTPMGKINDLMLYNLVSNLTDEQQGTLDSMLTSAMDDAGKKGLLDVKDNLPDVVKNGKQGIESLDESEKKNTTSTLESILTSYKNAKKTVIKGEFSTVKERIDK